MTAAEELLAATGNAARFTGRAGDRHGEPDGTASAPGILAGIREHGLDDGGGRYCHRRRQPIAAGRAGVPGLWVAVRGGQILIVARTPARLARRYREATSLCQGREGRDRAV